MATGWLESSVCEDGSRIMKCLTWFERAALLSIVCLILSSCQSSQPDNRPRFHEEASADVVLQFSRWDYIFMIRHDYREDGFQYQLNRETLGQAFDRMQVQRGMAVVMIGWLYDENQMAGLVAEWNLILKSHGFRRVVCVHPTGDKMIDGAVIIDDSNQSVDRPKETVKL